MCIRDRDLADGGPGTGAHASFHHGGIGGCRRGGFAHGQSGPHAGLADSQVVQDRRRNNRNFGRASVEADAFVFQVAAHAGGRFQSKGAAAGQQDAMNLFGHVARTEGVDFFGAGCRPANVHSRHSSRLAQDGGAAGDGVEVGNVSDADSGDVGKSFHGRLFQFAGCIGMVASDLGNNLLARPVERASHLGAGVLHADGPSPTEHFPPPSLRRRHHHSCLLYTSRCV